MFKDNPFISGSEQKPTQIQVGGQHYKKLAIQPVEYVHANNLGYFEGSVIKYVTRWRDKNGLEDLRKARHFLEILIELEEARDQETPKRAKQGPCSGHDGQEP